MTHESKPVACSIPLAEAGAQAVGWRDLSSKAQTAERIEGGVAMTFDDDLVATIDDLVAKEAECCDFLSITTEHADGTIRLVIAADRPGVSETIENLLGLSLR